MSVFHLAIVFGAAVLLVIAAISDAQSYRIPNKVCAAMLLLFPLFVMTAPGAIEWEQHLMVFGLMLASGFVMFAGNIAGAGDIKLLAATGLWAGPHLVAVFLITTAIAGGLAGACSWRCSRISATIVPRRTAVALARVPNPYGVAISIGGLERFRCCRNPFCFRAKRAPPCPNAKSFCSSPR